LSREKERSLGKTWSMEREYGTVKVANGFNQKLSNPTGELLRRFHGGQENLGEKKTNYYALKRKKGLEKWAFR